MLIMILIGVQYLQNLVFRFKTCLNCQNHSLSDSHDLLKKYLLPGKFSIPSYRYSCYLENAEFSAGIEKTIPKNHSSVAVFNKVSKWIIFGGCNNLAHITNRGFIFICTLIYKSF